MLALGALVVLPLVGAGRPRTSLAVGLSLAIGSLELVLDALPGIALRLHRTLVTSYFDVRAVHSWTPDALRDQQIAGAVLWCVAELLDLPFLILVYRQWLRADANDAARSTRCWRPNAPRAATRPTTRPATPRGGCRTRRCRNGCAGATTSPVRGSRPSP